MLSYPYVTHILFMHCWFKNIIFLTYNQNMILGSLCLSGFFIQNNYKFSSSSLCLYAIFMIPFQSLKLIEVFCRTRNLETIIQVEDWGTLDIFKYNGNTKMYFLQVYRLMGSWFLTEFFCSIQYNMLHIPLPWNILLGLVSSAW